MKALTVRQPWATLIALGAKRIETRSWSTRYRGPLAIHSSASFTRNMKKLCAHPPIREALGPFIGPEQLTLGAVIAVVELVDCTLITGPESEPDEPESHFGIYEPGRYAWRLANVQRIGPFPARGWLGMWDWDVEAVLGEMNQKLVSLKKVIVQSLDEEWA